MTITQRVALILYLSLWAAISAGVVFGMTRAGYPLWAAAGTAYLLFLFLNGTLAYRSRVRALRREGKEPPSYLRYLINPGRRIKLNDEAPWPMQALVGLIVAVAGVLLVVCGIALALHAEWLELPHPIAAAMLCLILTGIGAALLYLAWRLFTFRRPSNDTA